MVDTLDLKSNGHYGCGGSSPPPGTFAGVAQLVEHDLAKVGVASSSLVSRSLLILNIERCWGFFISYNSRG
jgi:hypothetical protein